MAAQQNTRRDVWSMTLFGIVFSAIGALAWAGLDHTRLDGHDVMAERVHHIESAIPDFSDRLRRVEHIVTAIATKQGVQVSPP